MPLRRLSQAVIHAIAAGEVIERPAVVIKELIENSLDAGATNIEIWLGPDPRTSFRVHDNGTGIAKSDFSLLAQPHTTSKIENVDDLQKIHSFGFRGEALASLVAVADVKIQTKTANQDHGFELHFQFGEHSTPVKIGMNTGTTITVEKLFDKLPARKKFLVKPASELKKIVEVVTASALAHPEVSFSLLHQKKELLKTSTAPKWQDRIQQLFGNTVTDQGQWLDENRDIVKVKGFLGHPQTARKTAQQHIFINRRPIQLPQLNQLVKELYGSLIEPKLQPHFILQLEIFPQLIDINIHPRKTTVQFYEPEKLFALLRQVLSETLAARDLSYQARPNQAWQLSTQLADRGTFPELHQYLRNEAGEALKQLAAMPPSAIQVHQTYIVTAIEGNLVLMDQHAAHERVLYHQLEETWKNQLGNLQTFEPGSPILIKTDSLDQFVLEEYQGILEKMGFEISEFGPKTWRVIKVPLVLQDQDIPQLISRVCDDLANGVSVAEAQSFAERTLAYVACRSAIKAGDPMTMEQINTLIKKLAETPKNTTCPHGRPTHITISNTDLEKMFHRR